MGYIPNTSPYQKKTCPDLFVANETNNMLMAEFGLKVSDQCNKALIHADKKMS